MEHLKFAVNLAQGFKEGKSFAKGIAVFRRKEVAKPFSDNFLTGVTKCFKPLLVHLNKIALKIKRLIAKRGFIE